MRYTAQDDLLERSQCNEYLGLVFVPLSCYYSLLLAESSQELGDTGISLYSPLNTASQGIEQGE
jgi:hypothetical protein